jgi:molybdopterin-guanine dinucleotide biosynthesis protein A
MKILGAVIAGGQARRFGSDKALSVYNGQRLIDIIGNSLRKQVDDVVVCGRPLPGWVSLADRPAPALGPLGGLCAALSYAKESGYDAVLSVAADVIPMPEELAGWLMAESKSNTRATVVKGQHLLGLWPAMFAERLDEHLATTTDRSLRGWIAECSAVAVSVPVSFANINTPQDLHDLSNSLTRDHNGI